MVGQDEIDSRELRGWNWEDSVGGWMEEAEGRESRMNTVEPGGCR